MRLHAWLRNMANSVSRGCLGHILGKILALPRRHRVQRKTFTRRRISWSSERAVCSALGPACVLRSPQSDSTVTTPELTVKNPVYLFPSISTVTGYSCGCFSGMAVRCAPVVELPNLCRQSKNLLLGFICRLPPLTDYPGTAR